jgi:hypothetical protein
MVHAEIKFGQVTVEMLAIDVLINADDAAFKHAEKPFQRIRVNVAARPFVFGMVNGLMLGRAGGSSSGGLDISAMGISNDQYPKPSD